MNTLETDNAPRAVRDLYHAARERHLDAGKAHDAAERMALGEVRRAGWFKTSKGWRQLTSDMRDKVSVREAIKQPDGRFVIEDVEVFYPNAVKHGPDGTPIPFTRADVKRHIANTNRCSTRCALTRGHPHPLQKAAGHQLPSYGTPVNFREHPQKPGRAVCDLVDVAPDVVDDLLARKLPGLSAGFAQDGGGLNRRFGHVALLGGDSPALSRLPALELVYSSPNQVCFSAEAPAFRPRPAATAKGSPMTPAQRLQFAAAISAAYASKSAGEEGADDKINEACEMYEAEMAPPEADPAAESAAPAIDPAALTGAAAEAPAFEADPVAAFNAQAARLGQVEKALKASVALIKAGDRKLKTQDTIAFCADLRGKGHQLPDEAMITEHLDVCFSAADPEKALASFRRMLSASQRTSLSEAGTTFGADPTQPGATGRKAAPSKAAGVLEIAESINYSGEFSADDMAAIESMAAAVTPGN